MVKLRVDLDGLKSQMAQLQKDITAKEETISGVHQELQAANEELKADLASGASTPTASSMDDLLSSANAEQLKGWLEAGLEAKLRANIVEAAAEGASRTPPEGTGQAPKPDQPAQGNASSGTGPAPMHVDGAAAQAGPQSQAGQQAAKTAEAVKRAALLHAEVSSRKNRKTAPAGSDG